MNLLERRAFFIALALLLIGCASPTAADMSNRGNGWTFIAQSPCHFNTYSKITSDVHSLYVMCPDGSIYQR